TEPTQSETIIEYASNKIVNQLRNLPGHDSKWLKPLPPGIIFILVAFCIYILIGSPLEVLLSFIVI
ncbi:MAG: hypothetical protein ACXAD7_19810, partial [Candidatus Kariarchaeaceae archaeon]